MANIKNNVAQATGRPDCLTYEDYAVWMAARGEKAITRHQWNLIIFGADGFTMLPDYHVEHHIKKSDEVKPSDFSLQTKDIIGKTDEKGETRIGYRDHTGRDLAGYAPNAGSVVLVPADVPIVDSLKMQVLRGDAPHNRLSGGNAQPHTMPLDDLTDGGKVETQPTLIQRITGRG